LLATLELRDNDGCREALWLWPWLRLWLWLWRWL